MVYSCSKSSCLPTVFNASENLAVNSSSRVSWSDARSHPMDWATFSTSSRVLLTRTKNVTLMSARMLSLQINPSLPRRSISMVFTEMSITSARCTTGSTTAPVKVTVGSFFMVLTINAALDRPCGRTG